jgi:NAD(P)H dehydrogenase (quinone)
MTGKPPHRSVLIVVSHPDDASSSLAIARRSDAALQALGFTTHLCDLYRDNFNPLLTKGEVRGSKTEGSAYAFEKSFDLGNVPKGLLRTNVAVVFNTSNTAEERERLVFGDPLDRIWKDCLLRYCGVKKVVRHVFRIVATSSVTDVKRWLDEVNHILSRPY